MPLTSSVMTLNFVCVSNFRLYCCSKKFQMLRKNVKSLLEQFRVCIFAEMVFGVRCTLISPLVVGVYLTNLSQLMLFQFIKRTRSLASITTDPFHCSPFSLKSWRSLYITDLSLLLINTIFCMTNNLVLGEIIPLFMQLF